MVTKDERTDPIARMLQPFRPGDAGTKPGRSVKTVLATQLLNLRRVNRPVKSEDANSILSLLVWKNLPCAEKTFYALRRLFFHRKVKRAALLRPLRALTKIKLVQIAIKWAAVHQLFMRPMVEDFAVFQHQNAVR